MQISTYIKNHKSYKYVQDVITGAVNAPVYVIKQCKIIDDIFKDRDEKRTLNEKKLKKIDKILKLLKMPKGLERGKSMYNTLAGFQMLLIVAALCVVDRANPQKRSYETVTLEICRKNGKTFMCAVIFLILFLIEPEFSKFYSVAPDGSLSKEVKSALEEIIKANSDILPLEGGEAVFKIRRDDIECLLNSNKYVPLNYSNSRLDGKLPSVFLADEVGALPNSYAIEAMRSGQLTILNRLGFIISTKYPTISNPFEDEVEYAKKVLDGAQTDDTLFALLYEPDNTEDWQTDDSIILQSNPLAQEMPALLETIKHKRDRAITQASARENFVTKHCNIIYQGLGTESYIDVNRLRLGALDSINWSGMQVWAGVDLSMTNDNCSVAIVGADEDENIYAEAMIFIPEGRIDEKSRFEKIDYRQLIAAGECIACGDMTVDYSVIEDYVLSLEDRLGCTLTAIGYDRYNAMSSAQKWNNAGYNAIEIRQHSDTLHAPTKLLSETIDNNNFYYKKSKLYEINYQNAKCTYDTNLNRYVSKKKSNGKIDAVIATINAVCLMQQDIIFNDDFFVQSL